MSEKASYTFSGSRKRGKTEEAMTAGHGRREKERADHRLKTFWLARGYGMKLSIKSDEAGNGERGNKK